jgi:tripartite-type tricarboxylate transporter receptor subunit TctC
MPAFNNPLLLKTIGVLLVLTPLVAAAQQYPVKPIRLIIPFPPGGGNDTIARPVAAALSERLGRHVIVDNRSGAGGVIGTELVANAPKDGYTLLQVSLAHAVQPWLYDLKGRYDPIKAFTPVAMLASSPNALTVHPGLSAYNVKELIALAKQQPGKIGWAGSNVGSFQHLGGSLFELQAGVKFLFVPFKGGGPATLDVIAGHNKVLFAGLFGSMTHVRSGKLRVLGVGSLKRNSAVPDVPTISEAGVPGYEAVNWFGIAAPAGTPPAIVERLHKEISAVQDLPAVRQHFEADGAEVVRMSSAEFGTFMVTELEKWGRVLKEGGIKAQ